MNRLSCVLLTTILAVLPLCTVIAADEPAEGSPIIFIYDSSGSMWGQIDGTAKVEIAREVMAATAANLPPEQEVGLVAYGHRSEGDCRDVETLLTNATPEAISPALNAIRPLGKTPLAWSATQVIEQLKQEQKKATIILLTDGIESCDGNLCDVVRDARASGIDFVLHIIGFGLKPGETGPLQCAAEAGGGSYFDAENAEELAVGMTEATAQTVDEKVNITLTATKNGEPLDVYIEAFPPGESKAVGNARSYHKGARFYLPPGVYDLKVSALENTDLKPIWIRGVETSDEELSEQQVSFDAGTVRMNVLNNGEGWDATVKLYDGEEIIARMRTYGRAQDMQVPPGVYTAKVQALAVEGMTTEFEVADIAVQAGEVTEVEHPFFTGFAMIGVSIGDELVDSMVSVYDLESGQNVAGARTYTSDSSNPRKFVLTPGSYSVKYATLGKHKGQSDTFEMTIEPGETFEKLIKLE